ncbi:hypothetical protein AA0488_0763 [Kozakia baliensis NRIC 0488]|nr:hypothetical protein AA0488_0763 [Kozakia baliensis NRIC 0488]GEL64840.1 hypothetical protein KBA01_21260 [Kozakia baliensis]
MAYSIETKTYNDLVTRDPEGIGAVLILLCVPDNPAEWVEVSEDYIRMRRCCYYSVLSGDPVANEGSTKKILIARKNVLTPEALIRLLTTERERKLGAAS